MSISTLFVDANNTVDVVQSENFAKRFETVITGIITVANRNYIGLKKENNRLRKELVEAQSDYLHKTRICRLRQDDNQLFYLFIDVLLAWQRMVTIMSDIIRCDKEIFKANLLSCHLMITASAMEIVFEKTVKYSIEFNSSQKIHYDLLVRSEEKGFIDPILSDGVLSAYEIKIETAFKFIGYYIETERLLDMVLDYLTVYSSNILII